MKKLIAVCLTMMVVQGTSAVFGEERYVGESLDNGLGQLAATYAAEEFKKKADGSVEWPFAI